MSAQSDLAPDKLSPHQNMSIFRSVKLHWFICLALPALAFGAAHASGKFTPGGCWFFAVTSLAICIWGFNLLNDGLVAVMLPVAYILTGVGSPADMLAHWTTSMGWLVLGGLMSGLALSSSGLAKRIALWAMRLTQGSFVRLIWGILLAGFIVAPMMPTVIGKTVLFTIICVGICDAMGFAPKSRMATTLLMGGFIAANSPRMGLYTGGGDITLGMQLLGAQGHKLAWLEYLLQNYLPSLIYSALSILVLLLVMRPKVNANIREYVETQYKALGPMSLKEKKTAALFIVLILLMMTDKFHGIDVGWIMMLAGCAVFLPGINLAESKQFSSLNLTAVLFVVGCMSIGAAAKSTGVSKIIADGMMPLLSGRGELATLVSTYMAAVGLKFLLTPVAAIGVFTAPLVDLANSLGFNPLGVVYSFMYGLDQYILPYEFAPLLYLFSVGYVGLGDMVKVFACRALLGLVLLVVCMYPYWKLTGAM